MLTQHDIHASLSSSPNPLQEMILELLHVFSGAMRGALMPRSLDPAGHNYRNYHVWPEVMLDQITPWLPQVLRHVRGCYNTLLTLDLPNDALDVIRDLIFDLRFDSILLCVAIKNFLSPIQQIYFDPFLLHFSFLFPLSNLTCHLISLKFFF